MLINIDAAISIECFYCLKYQVILILLKSLINPEGIVGQTIKVNRSLFEVILLSDKSHKIPIQNENKFYCEASGLGIPKKIFCDVDLTLGDKDFELKQKIYSSGLGGIFPKGIEIGSIYEIKI